MLTACCSRVGWVYILHGRYHKLLVMARRFVSLGWSRWITQDETRKDIRIRQPMKQSEIVRKIPTQGGFTCY